VKNGNIPEKSNYIKKRAWGEGAEAKKKPGGSMLPSNETMEKDEPHFIGQGCERI